MNYHKPNLTYRVTELDTGFMARCRAIPQVTVYIRNEKEIDHIINKSLQTYIDLFPHKVDKALVEDRTLRIIKER